MWPFANFIGILAQRKVDANTIQRPKPVQSGSVAWGPLSLSGFDAMHRGDAFYLLLASLTWYFTWPNKADTGTLSARWIAPILVRNLAFEIGLYELWHQLLYGVWANNATRKHKYNEDDPYKAGSSMAWRERFWTINGFIWSTVYECLVIYLWGSNTLPVCDGELTPAYFAWGEVVVSQTFHQSAKHPSSPAGSC